MRSLPLSRLFSVLYAVVLLASPLAAQNQHAEIEESGATVVGKGKPGYPGGTKIPPTTVEITRPPE